MDQNRSSLQATQGYTFTASNDTYSHLLLCKICKQLMIEPSRLYPCGHTYCKSCILQHNKKLSESSNSSRQNKCFLPFPECGKYYITLQPDLLAASLINDLEVKCLSDGCPWTGTLQRFKLSHKQLCKFKKGGLSSWLSDFNEDVKSIKRIRNERKINECIAIDDGNDQVEPFNLNSYSLCDEKDKSNQQPQKQQQKQQKSILGLNKNRVGETRKKDKSKTQLLTVDLDEDSCQQQNKAEQIMSSSKQKTKKSPIQLIDFNERQVVQLGKYKMKPIQTIQNAPQKPKTIEQNYTGLKMINSYKKKSHKIAQNPHNMNLTRSQPQPSQYDQFLSIK